MLRQKLFVCLFSVFLLSSLPLATQAQDTDNETAQLFIDQADAFFKETKAYKEALEQYVLALNFAPDNVYANYMAGQLHLATTDKGQSVKYFLKVYELDPEYRFNILYLIGQGYQYGNEFDKALDYYKQYKEKVNDEINYRGKDKTQLSEVNRRINECENGKEFMMNPSHYTIVNVGRGVNSQGWDYAPVLNRDETMMIFTTRRKEGNLSENVDDDNFPFEDIFIAYKKDGKWGEAENIGETVNTPFHDSNIALSADGNQLYLYKDDNAGDIYVSEKQGQEWTAPVPLSAAINSQTYAEKSVSISSDGNALFFSSNRPGGQGGLDIYVSTKNRRGEWTRSENLGEMINSAFDEDSPFIDYDGKTLYFSSNGRNGMGGYDIFKAEYDSATQEWSEPMNLGYPINTPDNDIFFVSTNDGKRGYYASVREDGMGYLDIYMVTIPELAEGNQKIGNRDRKEASAVTNKTDKDKSKDPEQIEVKNYEPITLLIRVRDQQSRMPVEARVKLTNQTTRMESYGEQVDEGIYEFEIVQQEAQNYMLSVESQSYMFSNLKLKIPASEEEKQTLRKTINLRPLTTGDRFVLRNIYFDFDKTSLQMESYNELNKVVRVMQENPELKVEISGHTDNIGTWAYNKKLSQRRANSVADYMISKGIDPSRIRSVGYGETKPLASNDDEFEGRELNRRVEFKVLSNGEEISN